MTSVRGKCPLWKTNGTIRDTYHTLTVDSQRAGGTYLILDRIAEWLQNGYPDHLGAPKLTDKIRAQITTWLVNQRRQVNESPELTREVIERACNGQMQPMTLKDKADRLLENIASEVVTGTSVVFRQVTTDECQAACEAENQSEAELLLGYLLKRGCLEQVGSRADFVRVSV